MESTPQRQVSNQALLLGDITKRPSVYVRLRNTPIEFKRPSEQFQTHILHSRLAPSNVKSRIDTGVTGSHPLHNTTSRATPPSSSSPLSASNLASTEGCVSILDGATTVVVHAPAKCNYAHLPAQQHWFEFDGCFSAMSLVEAQTMMPLLREQHQRRLSKNLGPHTNHHSVSHHQQFSRQNTNDGVVAAAATTSPSKQQRNLRNKEKEQQHQLTTALAQDALIPILPDTPAPVQDEYLFEKVARPAIEAVIQFRVPGCLLGYGMTSSGKTRSLFGSEAQSAANVHNIQLSQQQQQQQHQQRQKQVSTSATSNNVVFASPASPNKTKKKSRNAADNFVISPSSVYNASLKIAKDPSNRQPNAGLVHLACNRLLEVYPHGVCISFFEVYDEKLRCLFSGGDVSPVLTNEGMIFRGLVRVVIKSNEELRNKINEGMKLRKVASTHRNDHSSRSHAVLQMFPILEMMSVPVGAGITTPSSSLSTHGATITKKDVLAMQQLQQQQQEQHQDGDKMSDAAAPSTAPAKPLLLLPMISERVRFTVVDLAGSERLNAASPAQQRESAQINLALSNLGRVIQSLSQLRSHQHQHHSSTSSSSSSSGESGATAAAVAVASHNDNQHQHQQQQQQQHQQKENVDPECRASALTWALRDELQFKTAVSFLITISPMTIHANETLSSLRFAGMLRNIRTVIRINQPMHNHELKVASENIVRALDLKRQATAAATAVNVLGPSSPLSSCRKRAPGARQPHGGGGGGLVSGSRSRRCRSGGNENDQASSALCATDARLDDDDNYGDDQHQQQQQQQQQEQFFVEENVGGPWSLHSPGPRAPPRDATNDCETPRGSKTLAAARQQKKNELKNKTDKNAKSSVSQQQSDKKRRSVTNSVRSLSTGASKEAVVEAFTAASEPCFPRVNDNSDNKEANPIISFAESCTQYSPPQRYEQVENGDEDDDHHHHHSVTGSSETMLLSRMDQEAERLFQQQDDDEEVILPYFAEQDDGELHVLPTNKQLHTPNFEPSPERKSQRRKSCSNSSVASLNLDEVEEAVASALHHQQQEHEVAADQSRSIRQWSEQQQQKRSASPSSPSATKINTSSIVRDSTVAFITSANIDFESLDQIVIDQEDELLDKSDDRNNHHHHHHHQLKLYSATTPILSLSDCDFVIVGKLDGVQKWWRHFKNESPIYTEELIISCVVLASDHVRDECECDKNGDEATTCKSSSPFLSSCSSSSSTCFVLSRSSRTPVAGADTEQQRRHQRHETNDASLSSTFTTPSPHHHHSHQRQHPSSPSKWCWWGQFWNENGCSSSSCSLVAKITRARQTESIFVAEEDLLAFALQHGDGLDLVASETGQIQLRLHLIDSRRGPISTMSVTTSSKMMTTTMKRNNNSMKQEQGNSTSQHQTQQYLHHHHRHHLDPKSTELMQESLQKRSEVQREFVNDNVDTINGTLPPLQKQTAEVDKRVEKRFPTKTTATTTTSKKRSVSFARDDDGDTEENKSEIETNCNGSNHNNNKARSLASFVAPHSQRKLFLAAFGAHDDNNNILFNPVGRPRQAFSTSMPEGDDDSHYHHRREQLQLHQKQQKESSRSISRDESCHKASSTSAASSAPRTEPSPTRPNVAAVALHQCDEVLKGANEIEVVNVDKSNNNNNGSDDDDRDDDNNDTFKFSGEYEGPDESEFRKSLSVVVTANGDYYNRKSDRNNGVPFSLFEQQEQARLVRVPPVRAASASVDPSSVPSSSSSSLWRSSILQGKIHQRSQSAVVAAAVAASTPFASSSLTASTSHVVASASQRQHGATSTSTSTSINPSAANSKQNSQERDFEPEPHNPITFACDSTDTEKGSRHEGDDDNNNNNSNNNNNNNNKCDRNNRRHHLHRTTEQQQQFAPFAIIEDEERGGIVSFSRQGSFAYRAPASSSISQLRPSISVDRADWSNNNDGGGREEQSMREKEMKNCDVVRDISGRSKRPSLNRNTFAQTLRRHASASLSASSSSFVSDTKSKKSKSQSASVLRASHGTMTTTTMTMSGNASARSSVSLAVSDEGIGQIDENFLFDGYYHHHRRNNSHNPNKKHLIISSRSRSGGRAVSTPRPPSARKKRFATPLDAIRGIVGGNAAVNKNNNNFTNTNHSNSNNNPHHAFSNNKSSSSSSLTSAASVAAGGAGAGGFFRKFKARIESLLNLNSKSSSNAQPPENASSLRLTMAMEQQRLRRRRVPSANPRKSPEQRFIESGKNSLKNLVEIRQYRKVANNNANHPGGSLPAK